MQKVLLFKRPIALYHCTAKSAPSTTNGPRVLIKTPSRHYSIGFDLLQKAPVAAIHVAQNVLQNVHEHSHLPWWAVIVGSTFALRSVVTLPLAVHQQKVLAKIELLTPTLKEYQEAVKHNVIVKCRRANLPVEEANKRIRKEARKVAKELYSQEGCHPLKVALLPWIQLPLWIIISFALRNMTGSYPSANPSPEVLQAFHVEGALWFPDLTMSDPYIILPMLLVATNLLNIELHALKRKSTSPSRIQRVMSNVFRLLTLGMGVVAAQMPAGMTLYWSMSSTYGLLQNIAFKFPTVLRTFGIPKTPSENKHPFKDIAATVQDRAKDFLRRQRTV